MATTAVTDITDVPTREHLRPAVDELLDEMVNGTDTHWEQYAQRLAAERALGAKIGMFSTWSVNNRLFLHAQVLRRNESVKGLYAGKKQWEKKGRAIREGEEPYVIFGVPSFLTRNPRPRNPQAQPNPATPQQNLATPQQNQANLNQPGQNQPGQNQPQGPLVRVARKPPVYKVYDWTQTVAHDPDYVEPDWGVPLAFGDLTTLRRLEQTSTVPVTFRADIASRNEHGWLDRSGITIDASMPIGNQIFTLLHELAHLNLGHLDQVNSTAAPAAAGDETYAVCEQEAALAQFLAMKMLGLDERVGNNITTAAGAYLRAWIETDKDGKTVPVLGRKKKRKLIVSRLDAAFKAADKIVGAYLRELEAAAA